MVVTSSRMMSFNNTSFFQLRGVVEIDDHKLKRPGLIFPERIRNRQSSNSGVESFSLLEELASDVDLGLFFRVVDNSLEFSRSSGGILIFH